MAGVLSEYPNTLKLDFRALQPSSLQRYIEYFGLESNIPDNLTHYERATAVGRAFQNSAAKIDRFSEQAILNRFVRFVRTPKRKCYGSDEDEDYERYESRKRFRRGDEDTTSSPSSISFSHPHSSRRYSPDLPTAQHTSSSSSSRVVLARPKNGHTLRDEEAMNMPNISLNDASTYPGKRQHGSPDRKKEKQGRKKAAEAAGAVSLPASSTAGSSPSSTPGSSSSSSNSPAVYCICQQPSHGRMIACESNECRTPREWYHLTCVGLEVEPDYWICPACVRRSQNSGPTGCGAGAGGKGGSTGRGRSDSSSSLNNQSPGLRGAGGTITYGRMIEGALKALPRQQGTFKQICFQTEEQFSDHLNWKLESEHRRTPVWKASVRKTLLSNPNFSRTRRDKSVFCFSHDPAAAGNGNGGEEGA